MARNLSILLLLLFAATAPGQTQGPGNLADASLEQLLNTPVTSVSKKEQSLARTAASVFVISQDDIRRSGAENIPDVLRLVPGVEVAQVNANTWAVSIRGFNQRYVNKLLVLIDGRSLYSTTFGGVYWDQVNVPLPDIERIEVIRGPGASVWGANAVNGVINIITKRSDATKSGYIEASGASDGGAQGLFRYGAAVGAAGSFRVEAGGAQLADTKLPDGASAEDGGPHSRAGFRSDWELTPSDSLTVEGSAFANRNPALRFSGFLSLPTDTILQEKNDSAGGDFLARWTHKSGSGTETSVQFSYDHFRRNEAGVPAAETTYDLEVQQHRRLGSRQDLVWGFGYRDLSSAFATGYAVTMTPAIRVDTLGNGFFQDEIQVSNQLWLTIGTKVEHNSYTGWEFEPSARLAWTPSSNHSVWASASRAIRQPTREETSASLTLDSAPVAPGLVDAFSLVGNPSFRSENLNDYEAGYRGQWTPSVSLDVSSFFSLYRDLSSFTVLTPSVIAGPVVEIQVPVSFGNGGTAVDYGGDAFLSWTPSSRARLSLGYSLLHMNIVTPAGDPYSRAFDTYAPENSAQFRSSLSLTRRLEWSQALYWTQTTINHVVPAHFRLDSSLRYRLSESIDLAVTGQNLLAPGFMEFGNTEELLGSLTPRTIAGKITWKF